MKRITALFLAFVTLLSLAACGLIEDKRLDNALAKGDLHALVPEGEQFAHEDGTFQDFDTYCVFTVDAYTWGLQTGDFDHIVEYSFTYHPDKPDMRQYSYTYEGTTYYINVYSVYEPAKTVVIAGTELPGWEEGWAYMELESGQVPPHPSTLLPYESAPAEVLDGRTVYTLDTVTKDALKDYGWYLISEGWIMVTDVYDNPTGEYRYIEQFHKDDTYIMILWYNYMTKVIVSNEKIRDSEESLWAMVQSTGTIVAGEQYMRRQIAYLGPAVDRVGTGEGYSPTDGIVYRFTYHGTETMFYELTSKAQTLGFTEGVTQTNENGVYEFSAWRGDTYGDDGIMFFVHIIFDGEYLETQMGKNADNGSHRESAG